MILSHSYTREYLQQHKAAIAGILILGLVNSIVTFLLPLTLGDFFSIQYQEDGAKSKFLHSLGIHLTNFTSFFIFFVILLVVKLITGYFQGYLSGRQGELFVKKLREKIFYSQVNWPGETFQKKSFGNYLLRYTNDMKSLQNYLVKGILEGIRTGIFVILGIVLLAGIDLSFAIAVLIILALSLPFFRVLWKKQKLAVSSGRDKRSGMLAFVARKFSRFLLLKTRQSEVEAVERFNEKSSGLFNANIQTLKIENSIQVWISIIPFLLIGILLIMQAAGAIHLSHSNGLISVLILLMMQTSIRTLLKIPTVINKGKISLQKIEELLNEN